ncbi:MAG: CPBP family intramembrane glutamic endopeptidase [Halobacteriales archaeon]|nr:CPBP family intramembrane glutamic endopeptidase [Halobacteriales archaeon]
MTAGSPLPFTPGTFLALQLGQLLIVAPLVNSLFTFGEEFGWRGYLLPKLLPLGARRALLAHGVIWGVWHWPIIAMGHNYGLEYPGAPWTGLAAMTLFTVGVGVVLGWLTLRSGSVWPAVLGHAMVNGAAGLGLLFLATPPRLLLGPTSSGLLAMLPWLAVAAWLLGRRARLRPTDAVDWP